MIETQQMIENFLVWVCLVAFCLLGLTYTLGLFASHPFLRFWLWTCGLLGGSGMLVLWYCGLVVGVSVFRLWVSAEVGT